MKGARRGADALHGTGARTARHRRQRHRPGGAIETDFGGGVVRDDPQVNQFVASSTAMGRAGLPDDIGGAIRSLLTGDHQWMTGQRIEVSGGQSL